jgi:hypothetical protein
VQHFLQITVKKLKVNRDVLILMSDAVLSGGLEVSFQGLKIMMRSKNSKVSSGNFGP